ncbi:Dual-specificity kinase, spindle pole body (SPB) duplication and spindle checkpoint function [Mortierella sp. AD031]|nr:Dual-specificity kinase, spindle pole body (SPB) duplication and spindle checkpoint function [Mortierella sp. AD031]
MTDLECREKKRGPPPKLQPINIGQPKDKEAHLADYFGEGSLPSAPSTLNIRPQKRSIFADKPNSSNSSNSNNNSNNAHSAANATHSTTNTRDTSGLKSNSAGVHTDSKENPVQPSATVSILRSGHHSLAADRDSGLVDPKHPQALGNSGMAVDTSSDSSGLYRLRSQSRLARQEPLQRKDYVHASESDKPALTESMGTPSETKVMFSPPQSRISRNPEGKENLTPRTSMTSRSKIMKSMSTRSSAPRKSFNWGLPQRDAVAEPAEQEESKGSTPNHEHTIPPTVDKNMDTVVLSTPDDSGSSVDLPIQDLQVEDAPTGPGPTQERLGVKRDFDEAGSAAKRRKEFHPQDEPMRQEIKRVSFGIPTPPSPRLATTPHSPEQQTFTETKTKPCEGQATARPAAESEPTEKSPMPPPTSPRFARAPAHQSPPPAPSQYQQQQAQQQRPQHGDGIASIAQSLAVGSSKGQGLSRPFYSPPENQARPGNGIQPPPPFTVSPPFGANANRPELGNRPVMMVNNRPYTRLGVIGKGGSSKVFKVLATNSKVLALKRVSFDNVDTTTLNGFVNEINLLNRLCSNNSNSRIIKLFDAEINQPKGYLHMLMELGEIDLARMLWNQQFQPFDIHFIGLYWRQMLEAVQVIHDIKIVHSDLKPANFLLVEGSLKLIDFGIANAIANDTTNVHREGQIGTANYMAPEAINVNPTAGGYRKMGKPSDVWALGCILYQMVYGRTPYSDIPNVILKLKVIGDPDYQIKFPSTTLSPLRSQLHEPLLSQTQTQAAALDGGGNEIGGSGANMKATTATTGVDANGATATSSPLPESPAPPATPTLINVEPNLIRLMKGCLAFKAADRLTIPELLADPFLHPYKTGGYSLSSVGLGVSPESGAGVGSGSGSADTVAMDVETLRQLMQASMTYGANRAATTTTTTTTTATTTATNSPSFVRGGAIDSALVTFATNQVWKQLQTKKKADGRSILPGGFFISDQD